MDKVFVAKRVATKMRSAEHSVDTTMIEASELMGELLRARKELGVAANVGDAAIAKVSAALSLLAEARTSMVAAHSDLAEVQLRIGIRTRMDVEDKAEPTTAAAAREVA
ncbi:MAG TPA: hypothetical protein VMU37_00235 [Caulobacteraceae bacterium]|nr:hypothetical protein [Caulobacteraceae bacterium]